MVHSNKYYYVFMQEGTFSLWEMVNGFCTVEDAREERDYLKSVYGSRNVKMVTTTYDANPVEITKQLNGEK